MAGGAWTYLHLLALALADAYAGVRHGKSWHRGFPCIPPGGSPRLRPPCSAASKALLSRSGGTGTGAPSHSTSAPNKPTPIAHARMPASPAAVAGRSTAGSAPPRAQHRAACRIPRPTQAAPARPAGHAPRLPLQRLPQPLLQPSPPLLLLQLPLRGPPPRGVPHWRRQRMAAAAAAAGAATRAARGEGPRPAPGPAGAAAGRRTLWRRRAQSAGSLAGHGHDHHHGTMGMGGEHRLG